MIDLCRCGRPLVADRCPECNRSAMCRCADVETKRVPLWIERSRQRSGGLARDLTGAA